MCLCPPITLFITVHIKSLKRAKLMNYRGLYVAELCQQILGSPTDVSAFKCDENFMDYFLFPAANVSTALETCCSPPRKSINSQTGPKPPNCS